MVVVTCIVAIVALGAITFLIVANVDLKGRAADADKRAAEAHHEAEQAQSRLQSETARIRHEMKAALAEAQKLVDQQAEALKHESARVQEHYLNETRRLEAAAATSVAEMRQQLESLRKYESLRDAEEQVRKELAKAIDDTKAMREEAHRLVEIARVAAASEQAQTKEKARQIHEQADARLDQAIRDAGRIVADAEARAHAIGGEAYEALQDKRKLEQAAQAMRNIIEGYGDRYLVPTHILLDDLAAEYGYDAAGQSLASAREQSSALSPLQLGVA